MKADFDILNLLGGQNRPPRVQTGRSSPGFFFWAKNGGCYSAEGIKRFFRFSLVIFRILLYNICDNLIMGEEVIFVVTPYYETAEGE